MPIAGEPGMPCFWSSFAQTPAARLEYAVVPDDEYGRRLQPSAKVCKQKKDSHGKGNRVLRAVDFQETLEMVLATATRKDYRVLHANKEIRLKLNSDVHGSHVTWRLHHWYKSLAGGFGCVCEVWRCESAAGSKRCDSAAEHGRKYCLAHLVSKPR